MKLKELGNTMSTWKIGGMYQRDYITEARRSYSRQSNMALFEEQERKNLQLGLSHELSKDVQEANRQSRCVEKIEKIALSHFGSVQEMLRGFDKKKNDMISFDEFSANIQKHALESELPVDVQRSFFDLLKVNESKDGLVPLRSVVRCIDERVNVSDAGYKKDMFALRQYLATELHKYRQDNINCVDGKNSEDAANSSGNTGNKDDMMLKKAIGLKTFDLDIGAEEFEKLTENAMKSNSKENQKFARYLRMTNLKLSSVPFFDVRTDRLRLLKDQGAGLKQVIADKCDELVDLKKKNDDAIYRTSTFINKSSSTSHVGTNDGKNIHSSSSSSSLLSPIRKPSTIRNLAGEVEGPAGTTGNITSEQQYSSIPQEVVGRPVGKRMKYQEPLDFSRINCGGGSYDGINTDMLYRSVNSEMYPELIYENSKDVRRNVVSDASIAWNSKQALRAARYARTKANLDVTATRIQYDEAKDRLRELKRLEKQNNSVVLYQTNAFLNDVKSFKKQPLEIVSKKPHLSKSDSMWGGSMKYIINPNSNSSSSAADMQSTYRSSYNSDILTDYRHADYSTKLKNDIFHS